MDGKKGIAVGVFVLVALGALIVAFSAVHLIYRIFRKWAAEQILERPSPRLTVLNWTTNVAGATGIALLYDKLDVSQILDSEASIEDVLVTSALMAVIAVYSNLLIFHWLCESELAARLNREGVDRGVFEASAKVARYELDSERHLATTIGRILGDRWTRFRQLRERLETSKSRPTLEDLEAAVGADGQFLLILTSIHQVITHRFANGLDAQYSLRVAYYEPDGDSLRCRASYDGRHTGCISNPNTDLADRFKLTPGNSRDCLAVYCSMQAPMDPYLIGDAAKAHADPAVPYRHMSDGHDDRIKSIAAYACRSAVGDAGPHAVITLDTNKPGFFADSELSRLVLRRMLDELSVRLVYERDVAMLLSVVRKNSMKKEVADDLLANKS